MKKELIQDIIDSKFVGAFDEAVYQSQLIINNVLNITYQNII